MRYQEEMDYKGAIAQWKANREMVKKLRAAGGDLAKVLKDMYKGMPQKQRKKEADEIVRMLRERERARQLRRN